MQYKWHALKQSTIKQGLPVVLCEGGPGLVVNIHCKV